MNSLDESLPLEAPKNGNSGESHSEGGGEPLPKRMKVPTPLLMQAIGALSSWFLVFAAGLLVETVEYRVVLAPRSVKKQLTTAEWDDVVKTSALLKYQTETPRPVSEPSWIKIWQAYFGSILFFTPINLGLLTLIAGLVGGYSSHILLETMPEEELKRLQQEQGRSFAYLQEPPMTAAIRGFIVYLCVVAGLYIAMDDPFKDPTPAQYIRLAGTLSVLAFMVGYDSSRLEDWFNLIPRPGGRNAREADKKNQDRNHRDGAGDGRLTPWQEEAVSRTGGPDLPR